MRPTGVDKRHALPLAEASGCALRSYVGLDGQLTALRFGPFWDVELDNHVTTAGSACTGLTPTATTSR